MTLLPSVLWGARCRKAARRDLPGAHLVRGAPTDQNCTSGFLRVELREGAPLLDQIHTHCIEAVLRKAGEKAGIHAYPHKLRHFFADNAHEAGIDVLDISRMLGHESVETTKIYMSLNTDDLAHKHNKLR